MNERRANDMTEVVAAINKAKTNYSQYKKIREKVYGLNLSNDKNVYAPPRREKRVSGEVDEIAEIQRILDKNQTCDSQRIGRK